MEYFHTKRSKNPIEADYKESEHLIFHEGRQVLTELRRFSVLVPGYVRTYQFRKNESGLKITEVDPIPSEQRPSVEEVVRTHFKHILKKVYGNSGKIEVGFIDFW